MTSPFFFSIMRTPLARIACITYTAIVAALAIAHCVPTIDKAFVQMWDTRILMSALIPLGIVIGVQWHSRTQRIALFTQIYKTFLPSATIIVCASVFLPIVSPFLPRIQNPATALVTLWWIFFALRCWRALPGTQNDTDRYKTIFLETPLSHRIIVALITCAFLFIGLHNIGAQSLVDEPLWVYERVEKYWDNLLEGDWYNTRPNDKPGVTLAFFSGPGLIGYDHSIANKSETKILHDAHLTPEQRAQFLAGFRTPIVIVLALFLPILYSLSVPLIGRAAALIGLLLVATSPLIIGMSRIVNPDALFWMFFPLTLLAVGTFLWTRARSALFIATLFFGFTLLSKYVGNLLLVFFPFLSVVIALLSQDLHTSDALRRRFRDDWRAYAVFVIGGLLVFGILYPGAFIKPDRFLLATFWSQAFTGTLFSVANFSVRIWHIAVVVIGILLWDLFYRRTSTFALYAYHLRPYIIPLIRFSHIATGAIILVALVLPYFPMPPIPFTDIITSPKSASRIFGIAPIILSDYMILVFGMTIPALIGMLCALWHSMRARDAAYRTDGSIIFSTIGVFLLLIYYGGATASDVVATSRYQIALTAYVTLLAGSGYVTCLHALLHRNFTKFFWIICGILAISAYGTLWCAAPFYLSYANRFLPSSFVLNIKDMGDGSYEAAHYLNTLPNAHAITIWSDKMGVCAFFVGTCYADPAELRTHAHRSRFTYYVISTTRATLIQTRAHDKNFAHALYMAPGIFRVTPGMRDGLAVRIIRSQDLVVQ